MSKKGLTLLILLLLLPIVNSQCITDQGKIQIIQNKISDLRPDLTEPQANQLANSVFNNLQNQETKELVLAGVGGQQFQTEYKGINKFNTLNQEGQLIVGFNEELFFIENKEKHHSDLVSEFDQTKISHFDAVINYNDAKPSFEVIVQRDLDGEYILPKPQDALAFKQDMVARVEKILDANKDDENMKSIDEFEVKVSGLPIGWFKSGLGIISVSPNVLNFIDSQESSLVNKIVDENSETSIENNLLQKIQDKNLEQSIDTISVSESLNLNVRDSIALDNLNKLFKKNEGLSVADVESDLETRVDQLKTTDDIFEYTKEQYDSNNNKILYDLLNVGLPNQVMPASLKEYLNDIKELPLSKSDHYFIQKLMDYIHYGTTPQAYGLQYKTAGDLRFDYGDFEFSKTFIYAHREKVFRERLIELYAGTEDSIGILKIDESLEALINDLYDESSTKNNAVVAQEFTPLVEFLNKNGIKFNLFLKNTQRSFLQWAELLKRIQNNAINNQDTKALEEVNIYINELNNLVENDITLMDRDELTQITISVHKEMFSKIVDFDERTYNLYGSMFARGYYKDAANKLDEVLYNLKQRAIFMSPAATTSFSKYLSESEYQLLSSEEKTSYLRSYSKLIKNSQSEEQNSIQEVLSGEFSQIELDNLKSNFINVLKDSLSNDILKRKENTIEGLLNNYELLSKEFPDSKKVYLLRDGEIMYAIGRIVGDENQALAFISRETMMADDELLEYRKSLESDPANSHKYENQLKTSRVYGGLSNSDPDISILNQALDEVSGKVTPDTEQAVVTNLIYDTFTRLIAEKRNSDPKFKFETDRIHREFLEQSNSKKDDKLVVVDTGFKGTIPLLIMALDRINAGGTNEVFLYGITDELYGEILVIPHTKIVSGGVAEVEWIPPTISITGYDENGPQLSKTDFKHQYAFNLLVKEIINKVEI